MEKQEKSIQIEEDLEHQRKSWRFQRIGMAFLFAIVVLSVLGVGGNGPLSKVSIDSDKGLFKVEYQKIARSNSAIDLNIILREDLTRDDTLKVTISKSLIHFIEVKNIIPSPSNEADDNQNIVYMFIRGNHSHPNLVRINYQFRDYGLFENEIVISDDKAIINHFVWP